MCPLFYSFVFLSQARCNAFVEIFFVGFCTDFLYTRLILVPCILVHFWMYHTLFNIYLCFAMWLYEKTSAQRLLVRTMNSFTVIICTVAWEAYLTGSLAARSESCKLICTEERTKACCYHVTAQNTFMWNPDLVHHVELGTDYGDLLVFSRLSVSLT